MSVSALNWVLKRRDLDNSGAKFVLLILANYANENNESWPGQDTIALHTALSVRAVRNHLEWLEKHGYIIRKIRRNRNRRKTDLYVLTIACEQAEVAASKETEQEESSSSSEPAKSAGAKVSTGNFRQFEPAESSNPPTPPYMEEPSEEPSVEPNDSTITKLVFQEWQTVLNHNGARLDKKRKARIKARIREGFTLDDLKLVPHGVRRSPYHLGENDTGTVYDGIETVFRDAGQVEKFIALARQPMAVENRYVPTYCDACRDEDGLIPKIVDGVRRMAKCKHDQVKVAA